MKTIVRISLALAVTMAIAQGPAHAGTVRSIQQSGTSFDPAHTIAAAGDTIRVSYSSSGHTFTAWQGGSFDFTATAGDVFEVPFNGPALRFRCKPHSTLINGGTECQGMCAAVVTATADTTPPTANVNSPRENEVVVGTPNLDGTVPVTISGIASDNVGVKKIELVMNPVLVGRCGCSQTFPLTVSASATCSGCPGVAATWSASIALRPGVWEVQARAYDTSDNTVLTPIRTFFLL